MLAIVLCDPGIIADWISINCIIHRDHKTTPWCLMSCICGVLDLVYEIGILLEVHARILAIHFILIVTDKV